MDKNYARIIFETALIAFFLTVICAPPLMCIFSPKKEWSDKEKRVLASFPGIPTNFRTLLTFAKQFEDYYNDHFGLREVLIGRYQREMKRRFGQSGDPNVMVGKHGWYFWVGNGLLDDFRGLVPLPEQQLISWTEELVHKRDWLGKQGIHYLFVFVPDKQTVYPEYLPDDFQKAKGTTRFEQLTEHLNHRRNVEILDLRSALLNAKSTGRLYQKTDTHWNDYGAFVGYREIMHKISQWFPKEQFKFDFYFNDTMTERPAGDLARILGLQETIRELDLPLKERHSCAQPMELTPEIEDFLKTKDMQPFMKPFMKGCKDAHLRALVFRDSFFEMVHPFFSENFRQVVYLWRFYDQKTVERMIDYFHPHLVIEERIERFCFRDLKE